MRNSEHISEDRRRDRENVLVNSEDFSVGRTEDDVSIVSSKLVRLLHAAVP